MSTTAAGLIFFRRPTALLGALVLTSMLCACGGGGDGGADSALGPGDGANIGTPPVDDDDADPLSTTVPGFTGDPANGDLSDAAVMAQAFAPHAKVVTRFDDTR